MIPDYRCFEKKLKECIFCCTFLWHDDGGEDDDDDDYTLLARSLFVVVLPGAVAAVAAAASTIRGLCDVVLAARPSPTPGGPSEDNHPSATTRSGGSGWCWLWHWAVQRSVCTWSWKWLYSPERLLGMHIKMEISAKFPLAASQPAREHRVVIEILLYVYFVSLFAASFFLVPVHGTAALHRGRRRSVGSRVEKWATRRWL